jgi:hypothetical protein
LNGDTPTANQEGGKPMKPNHIALIVYAVGRPISIYFEIKVSFNFTYFEP